MNRSGIRLRTATIAAVAAIGSAAWAHDADGASSRTRFEPIAREARMELGVRNEFATVDEATKDIIARILGITEPFDYSYFAADLIVPASTTAELSLFIRKRGTSGARWFCSAYAEPPADAPDFPTLRTLILLAAADSPLGAEATNAVACPQRVARPKPAGGFAAIARIIFKAMLRAFGHEGTTISTAACVATDAMREAFDTDACEDVIFASRYTTRVFKRMTRQAARHHGCLRLRVAEHQAFDSAEPFSFFEISELTPCN